MICTALNGLVPGIPRHSHQPGCQTRTHPSPRARQPTVMNNRNPVSGNSPTRPAKWQFSPVHPKRNFAVPCRLLAIGYWLLDVGVRGRARSIRGHTELLRLGHPDTRRCLAQPSLPQGESHDLGPAAQAELLVDADPVGFDSLGAQAEVAGDFLVAITPSQ